MNNLRADVSGERATAALLVLRGAALGEGGAANKSSPTVSAYILLRALHASVANHMEPSDALLDAVLRTRAALLDRSPPPPPAEPSALALIGARHLRRPATADALHTASAETLPEGDLITATVDDGATRAQTANTRRRPPTIKASPIDVYVA